VDGVAGDTGITLEMSDDGIGLDVERRRAPDSPTGTLPDTRGVGIFFEPTVSLVQGWFGGIL